MNMKIIVEESISSLVSKVLKRVAKNWMVEEWQNAAMNPSIIENVLNEPHKLVDFTTEDGAHWAIIMPTEPGTLFILDYNLHENEIATYAGGALGGSDPQFNKDDLISVIVFGNEKPTSLELRIVHELIHGLDLPADDLQEYANQAFSPTSSWLYHLLQSLGVASEHMPFFQRRYYQWVLHSKKSETNR